MSILATFLAICSEKVALFVGNPLQAIENDVFARNERLVIVELNSAVTVIEKRT